MADAAVPSTISPKDRPHSSNRFFSGKIINIQREMPATSPTDPVAFSGNPFASFQTTSEQLVECDFEHASKISLVVSSGGPVWLYGGGGGGGLERLGGGEIGREGGREREREMNIIS